MIEIDELHSLFEKKNVIELKRYVLSIIDDSHNDFRPNWHPLGFIHCKLGANVYGETFRLHIWHPDLIPQYFQEHKVHDHLFLIESAVLVGSVSNKQYDFRSHPSHSSEYRVVRAPRVKILVASNELEF